MGLFLLSLHKKIKSSYISVDAENSVDADCWCLTYHEVSDPKCFSFLFYGENKISLYGSNGTGAKIPMQNISAIIWCENVKLWRCFLNQNQMQWCELDCRFAYYIFIHHHQPIFIWIIFQTCIIPIKTFTIRQSQPSIEVVCWQKQQNEVITNAISSTSMHCIYKPTRFRINSVTKIWLPLCVQKHCTHLLDT